ncbi:L-histidine N(alpha)-methyltransferase, partial [Acidovorax cavernicola]|uniref:L-histidine N(alpha)-methyltransferase n=1 Tax=Acidovorax cavernicola TaxID=1675792 RepID=UPI00142E53D1
MLLSVASADAQAPTSVSAPPAPAARQTLARDLSGTPARICAKYFYDQRGCELFEAITRLPEYYPTRTEKALLQARGADIARSVGPCT